MSSEVNPKILLVEDTKIMDEIFSSWIKESGLYEVIGPVSNYEDALKELIKNQGEIALSIIDIMIPPNNNERSIDGVYTSENGINLALEIRKREIPVILISVKVFPEIAEEILKNNISYILKYDTSRTTFLQEIEIAISGNAVFSNAIIAMLHHKILERKEVDPLDNEQWKLLVLHVCLYSIREISGILNLSEAAIKSRNRILYSVLNVSNVQEARRWFRLNANKFSWKKHISDFDESITKNIEIE